MITQQALDTDELVWEDERDFRVHGRIYTDPEVFDLEMERIFGRSWVYVGHESEVREGGDYKTAYVGLQPVIVTRNADDGAVYVLYNRCRHRAATVCQHEFGNANYFRCAYHGWTYTNRGDLIGVPYREGYGEGFDLGPMGLVHVPRLAIYKGFIFVRLSEEGPSLEEHLGNARRYLDNIAGQGPEGIEIHSDVVHKYGYDGNWKLQVENSVDNYHGNFVHASYFDIVEQRGGGKVNPSANPRSRTRDLSNGHALLDFGGAPIPAGTSDLPFTLGVFPNLATIGFQIRVVRPIAVNRTEVWVYVVFLKGVSAEENSMRLRRHEQFFGPAGFGGPDDVEVAMLRVTEGLKARGNEWNLLSRGLEREEIDEQYVRSGHITDETTQRAIYRQWKQLMAAGQ